MWQMCVIASRLLILSLINHISQTHRSRFSQFRLLVFKHLFSQKLDLKKKIRRKLAKLNKEKKSLLLDLVKIPSTQSNIRLITSSFWCCTSFFRFSFSKSTFCCVVFFTSLSSSSSISKLIFSSSALFSDLNESLKKFIIAHFSLACHLSRVGNILKSFFRN